MTFLEAAIELLRQAGQPLSIKDLTQRAIEQRLLTHEGRTPELTMQARLLQELRKGPHTLLVQNDKDSFGLRRYDKPRLAAGEVAPEPPAPAAEVSASAPAPSETAAEAEEALAAEGDGEGAEAAEAGEDGAEGAKRKRRRRGGRGRGKKKVEGEVSADEATAAPGVEVPAPARQAAKAEPEVEAEPEPVIEDGTPEEAIEAERLADEAERAEAMALAEAEHEQAAVLAEAARQRAHAERVRTESERVRTESERVRAEAGAEAERVRATDRAAAAEASRHVAEAARRAEEARAAAMFAPPGDDEPAVDLDGIMAPSLSRRGLIDLPDEEALAAEYGDELTPGGATVTAPVEGELVDERTADEDRPMLDEIQADDGRRGRNRRRGGPERGKGRGGKERGRPERGGRPGERAAGDRPASERREGRAAPAPQPAHAHAVHAPRPHARDAHAAEVAEVPVNGVPVPASAVLDETGPQPALPGGPRASLADIGYQILRSINDGRPVHARQIAAMALKRRLASGEPEDLWRALRVALLDDARTRVARGLRPRVRHQGSGNFALVTVRLEPELIALEDQLAQRAEALARETRLALRRRLAKLPLPALENLARVLLERLGYTDIERVKRVEATGYLTARVKHGALPTRVLIGVRSGGDEAGRRAVGELRAGVSAKQLDHGLLLCTTRVGAEADREARAPGPLCTCYDGDAFADALLSAGVGVLRTALPVAYLDAEFFAELTDSN